MSLLCEVHVLVEQIRSLTNPLYVQILLDLTNDLLKNIELNI